MKTRICKCDKHHPAKRWLGAETHPKIIFQFSKIEDVSLEKQSEA